jgi:hypothetical protein
VVRNDDDARKPGQMWTRRDGDLTAHERVSMRFIGHVSPLLKAVQTFDLVRIADRRRWAISIFPAVSRSATWVENKY